ncbi:MAG TPA: thioredoxin family protein [Vicinamibacterales bacterium]|jgi:thiol-disulfide isomerase/thioredoxin|nr:thioredoxin family protein [Vicinamibacterales bacterium]
MSRVLLIASIAGLLLVAWPLAAPPSADAVVAGAVARAKAEHKAVLIEFGASWCTWCRSFEAFVKSPDAGPVIARNYVVTNLVVEERDDKRALENPGGEALKTRWGGEKAGLPFYVFLDDAGRKVGDSNAMPGGGNIGFPAVPAEIAAFLDVVDKTAPSLTKADRDILRAYLTRVMPKRAS